MYYNQNSEEKKNDYYRLSEELLKNYFEKYPCLINEIVPNEMLNSKIFGCVDYPTLRQCKHESTIIDPEKIELLKVFQKFDNKEMLDEFVKLMFDFHPRFCQNHPFEFSQGKYKYQKYSELISTVILGNPTKEEKLDLFIRMLKNKIELKNDFEDFKNVYSILFTSDERHSLDVITKIIKEFDKAFKILLRYTLSQDRETLLLTFPKEAYKQSKQYLSKKEKELVENKIREIDPLFIINSEDTFKNKIEEIMAFNKSLLLKKLKDKYGKSYSSKTNTSLEEIDDEKFILAMLKSNVLEVVLTNPYYTINDSNTINALLHHFDLIGVDTTLIRQKISLVEKPQNDKDKSIYNFIINNPSNKEKLDNYLESIGITKDNFFSFINSRKFMDKRLKESILAILAKYYKTSIMSPLDILEVYDESNERKVDTLDIMAERKLNKKYVSISLDYIKEDNPNIYTLLELSKQNYSKSYKKLIKLYNQITSDTISDLDSFKETYNHTPEEILNLFIDTPLYNDILTKLNTWYNIPKQKIETI